MTEQQIRELALDEARADHPRAKLAELPAFAQERAVPVYNYLKTGALPPPAVTTTATTGTKP